MKRQVTLIGFDVFLIGRYCTLVIALFELDFRPEFVHLRRPRGVNSRCDQVIGCVEHLRSGVHIAFLQFQVGQLQLLPEFHLRGQGPLLLFRKGALRQLFLFGLVLHGFVQGGLSLLDILVILIVRYLFGQLLNGGIVRGPGIGQIAGIVQKVARPLGRHPRHTDAVLTHQKFLIDGIVKGFALLKGTGSPLDICQPFPALQVNGFSGGQVQALLKTQPGGIVLPGCQLEAPQPVSVGRLFRRISQHIPKRHRLLITVEGQGGLPDIFVNLPQEYIGPGALPVVLRAQAFLQAAVEQADGFLWVCIPAGTGLFQIGGITAGFATA